MWWPTYAPPFRESFARDSMGGEMKPSQPLSVCSGPRSPRSPRQRPSRGLARPDVGLSLFRCGLRLWIFGGILCGCAPRLSPEMVELARDAGAQVECAPLQERIISIVDAMASEPEDGAVSMEWGIPHRRLASKQAILEALSALGVEHRVVSMPDRHVPVENIVVELPGTGAGPGGAPASEVLQLTAHFDVWYTAADDNTSGVVSALEAIAILRNLELSRSIQVLFYDMEETGIDGSLAWWDRYGNNQVHAVLNLDAIAYASDKPGSQAAPPGFRLPSKGNFILGLGNGAARHHLRWMAELSAEIPDSAAFLAVYGPADNEHPATNDFHRSDHSPAWSRGLPGIFMTDTANLRNPHYHQLTDLPDTLDPAFHCGVTRLVVGSMAAYAEAP
ncbi:MAG TPA: hypothetical protein DFR83_25250 [Deltaproteobacteria bacterium]|nr:hypothetical protein [Deltaproteobacteria bacterium]